MSERTDVMAVTGRPTGVGVADWCPIERALKVIGTHSALVLLREAFWGARRFEDLARLSGITEQMAATRLKQLVEAGVLAKQPYKEPGKRTRYEYVLTPRGRQIYPVIVSLIEFGLTLQGDARRLDLIHGEGCGAAVSSHVQCAEGHHVPLDQAETKITAKTGAAVGRDAPKTRSTKKGSAH